MSRILMGSLLLLALAVPAAGQGTGNSVTLPIALPGGILGDVTVSFESVNGLTPDNLGVSARLVSPFDPLLGARLPSTVSIPLGFPVLIAIEPTPAGGLSFTGVATVQIHTPPLLNVLNLGSSLRLVSATLGGPFEDNTKSVQSDASNVRWTTSFRAIGSKGGFSEFLVVIDLRPLNQAIGAKLNRLDQILADNAGAIPEAVRTELAAELADARAHSLAGDEAAAIQDLDDFIATVQQHSGTDIPDVWRAARDRVNVAGLLRAGAETLQFSLRLRQGH